MRKILIIALLLTGCARQAAITTDGLVQDAKSACSKEKTSEEQLYCQFGYIISKCKIENLDLRLCGRLEKE